MLRNGDSDRLCVDIVDLECDDDWCVLVTWDTKLAADWSDC